MKRLLCSAVAALAFLGVSVGPSAADIASGGAPPGASVGLGTTTLQTIVLPDTSPTTTFYFFTPSVTGTFTINVFEGTSAGGTALSAFAIQLSNLTTATILGTDNTPEAAGSLQFVHLDNLPFISGNNYQLTVGAQASADNTFPVNVDGNVTVNAVPLPGSILLFGSGLAGLVALGRKRRQKAKAVAA